MSDTIYFPISKGLVTKIDADSYARLESEGLLKWYAQKSGKRFYVSRYIKGNGKLYLHRYIMNPPPGMCIDHINGDSLDNRKANLRICSYRQNAANKSMDGIKGVTNVRGKFYAQIQSDGEHINLGVFSTAGDAARAYDIAAAFLFKEFASFNFPFSKKFIKYAK